MQYVQNVTRVDRKADAPSNSALGNEPAPCKRANRMPGKFYTPNSPLSTLPHSFPPPNDLQGLPLPSHLFSDGKFLWSII